MSDDLIHIHEDAWGMRSLHPADALAEVEADLAKAREASEQNRAEDGFGWTDMHLIEAPSRSFASVGFQLADAVQLLSPIMPRVRRFYSTIWSAIGSDKRDSLGSYDDDAWCFGFGRHCYIKLDVRDDVLLGIWFDHNSDDPADAAALRAAFEAIDGRCPVIISDYRLEATGAVRDASFLERYFAELTS